jgi:hypothetical protein
MGWRRSAIVLQNGDVAAVYADHPTKCRLRITAGCPPCVQKRTKSRLSGRSRGASRRSEKHGHWILLLARVPSFCSNDAKFQTSWHSAWSRTWFLVQATPPVEEDLPSPECLRQWLDECDRFLRAAEIDLRARDSLRHRLLKAIAESLCNAVRKGEVEVDTDDVRHFAKPRAIDTSGRAFARMLDWFDQSVERGDAAIGQAAWRPRRVGTRGGPCAKFALVWRIDNHRELRHGSSVTQQRPYAVLYEAESKSLSISRIPTTGHFDAAPPARQNGSITGRVLNGLDPFAVGAAFVGMAGLKYAMDWLDHCLWLDIGPYLRTMF